MTEEVCSYLNASLTGHLSLARGERESLSKHMKVKEHRAKKTKFNSLCKKTE